MFVVATIAAAAATTIAGAVVYAAVVLVVAAVIIYQYSVNTEVTGGSVLDYGSSKFVFFRR